MFENIVPSSLVEPKEQVATPVRDDASKSMEAGYVSLFEQNPQDMLDVFWKVRSEQDELGYSPTSEGIKTALHQEESEAMSLSSGSAIMDANVPIEDKASILNVDTSSARKETPLQVKLMNELIIADDEEELPATDEQEEMRGLMAGAVKDLSDYREARRAITEQRNFTETQSGLF